MKILISKKYILHIEPLIFEAVSSFLSEKSEKIGLLFAIHFKDTNEFLINSFSLPHKKDLSTPIYCEISLKHLKKSKKIIKKNPNLFIIGYWHTHPNGLSSKPSKLDLNEFKKSSNESLFSKFQVYIIVSNDDLNIFLYKKGFLIKNKIFKWSQTKIP